MIILHIYAVIYDVVEGKWVCNVSKLHTKLNAIKLYWVANDGVILDRLWQLYIIDLFWLKMSWLGVLIPSWRPDINPTFIWNNDSTFQGLYLLGCKNQSCLGQNFIFNRADMLQMQLLWPLEGAPTLWVLQLDFHVFIRPSLFVCMYVCVWLWLCGYLMAMFFRKIQ